MWRSVLLTATVIGVCAAPAAAAAEQVSRFPASVAQPAARAPITVSPGLHGFEQARQRPDGTLVAKGTISGSGTVQANHVVIEGDLSPGNSPGCINFGGDVTFSFTAVLKIEVGGTAPCTEYDRVTVASTLTLNSPTLRVILLNSFPPQYGERFDILDWGTLAGTFGSIDTSAAGLAYPLVWDASQLYLTGELVVDVQHVADGDLAPWDAPDGNINAADVLIATQLVLGLRSTGPLQLAHGDMNSDGIIDLTDLLQIQDVILP